MGVKHGTRCCQTILGNCAVICSTLWYFVLQVMLSKWFNIVHVKHPYNLQLKTISL